MPELRAALTTDGDFVRVRVWQDEERHIDMDVPVTQPEQVDHIVSAAVRTWLNEGGVR